MKQTKNAFCAPSKTKVEEKNDVKTNKKKDICTDLQVDQPSSNKVKAPTFETGRNKTKIVPRSLTDEEYADIFKSVLAVACDNDSTDTGDVIEVQPEKGPQNPEKMTNGSAAAESDDELDAIASEVPVDQWNDGATEKSAKGKKSLNQKEEENEVYKPQGLPSKNKKTAVRKSRCTNKDQHTLSDEKNNKSNLNHGHSTDDDQEEEETGTWIQCSSPQCGKWRYVADIGDPSHVPEYWECSMNSDPDHNSCDAPEIEYDESEHIMTSFTLGSVVWAKMDGFPWWPAMVDSDPDYDTYFELPSLSSMVPYLYHVTFLDEHVSRVWIKSHLLAPYSSKLPLPEKLLSKSASYQRKDLKIAKANADRALKLNLTERLEQYSFIKRFSKSRKSQDKSLSRKRKHTLSQRKGSEKQKDISTEEILLSSNTMLQELDRAIETCNTSESDDYSSQDESINHHPKVAKSPDTHEKRRRRTSSYRSLKGREDAPDMDIMPDNRSSGTDIKVKGMSSSRNDDRGVKKDNHSNIDLDQENKSILFQSQSDKAMVNTVGPDHFKSKRKTKVLPSEKDSFGSSDAGPSKSHKKRKIKEDAQESKAVDGASTHSLEVKPECSKTDLTRSEKENEEDTFHSDSGSTTQQNEERREKDSKEISQVKKTKSFNDECALSDFDSEKENIDPNSLSNEEKKSFSRKQDKTEPIEKVLNKKKKKIETTETDKIHNKVGVPRTGNSQLSKKKQNGKEDSLNKSLHEKVGKSFKGLTKKTKHEKDKQPSKSNESTTYSCSTEPSSAENNTLVTESALQAEMKPDNGKDGNVLEAKDKQSKVPLLPNGSKKETVQTGNPSSKQVKNNDKLHPSSPKPSQGGKKSKPKGFMNPIRDLTSSKPTDRKVPSITTCEEDKEEKISPKHEENTDKDQSVPDLVANIAEDGVEMDLDLDQDIPLMGKDNDKYKTHSNDKLERDFSDDEDELNLSLDSLEGESHNVLHSVRLGGQVKTNDAAIAHDDHQSFGRFAGHCSDLGSQSDPFELIEE